MTNETTKAAIKADLAGISRRMFNRSSLDDVCSFGAQEDEYENAIVKHFVPLSILFCEVVILH